MEVDSTNSYIQRNLNHLPSWTMVYTAKQTAGRGASGNKWISNAYQNILMSLLIKEVPKTIKLLDFNKLIINSIHYTLNSYINCTIKWPNDILCNGKKIGGLLIENINKEGLQNLIIGIGININQTDFESLEYATSLKKELGQHFIVKEVIQTIMENIQDSFENYPDTAIIDQYYHKHLFGLNEVRSYEVHQKIIQGIFKGVDKTGKMILQNIDNQQIELFNLKDIRWLL